MLERSLGGVTAGTLVWTAGAAAWQPLSALAPFADAARLAMAVWYVVGEGRQTLGPLGSRDLLRMLQGGAEEPTQLVCSASVTDNAWRAVAEVPLLQAAMREQQEQQEQQQQQQQQQQQPPQQPQAQAQQPQAQAQPLDSSEAAFEVGEVHAPPPQRASASTAGVPGSGSSSAGTGRKRAREDHNTWVYVAGLPTDVTEAELVGYLQKAGLLALDADSQRPRVKLYRDEQGRPKGDASACFHQAASVQLALAVLDGGFLRAGGTPLSITTRAASAAAASSGASMHASASEEAGAARGGAEAPGAKRRRAAAPAVSHARVRTALQAVKAQLSWAEDGDEAAAGRGQGQGLQANLKIVILENLFSPADLVPTAQEVQAAAAAGLEARSAFEAELEEDVASECEKLGEVEKITLFSRNPRGVVAVKFRTAAAAQAAVRKMEGRCFGGRELRAYFFDGETDYTAGGSYEEAALREQQEEEKRQASFGSWLDGQSQLPPELQLRTE